MENNNLDNELFDNSAELLNMQLNTLVEVLNFPVWIKDVNNTYVMVNRAFEKFFNIKRENIVNRYVETALFENNLASANEINNMLAEDKQVLEEKIIKKRQLIIEANGEEKVIATTKAPILDARGICLGLIGYSFDVTDKIRYENLQIAAQAKEEELKEAKEDFLNNIGHEIRTPMNGVLGYLQLLANTELTEEQEKFVNEAQNSSEILLSLVNDLLDLSQAEAGNISMDRISFNLRYVLEDVATLAAKNIADRPIEINALCYSNVPERVIGDPTRLKQVLNNFLNNAIKFTNEGEINLTLKLVEQSGNQAKVLFKIQDTGIGISEEDQNSIFEAFSQVDSSATRRYGGTGVGLTIAKNLINLMNGEVFLHSVVDAGSTFSFTACFDIDQTPQIIENDVKKSFADTKVLIVDDNITNLKVLEHYLSEYNCETVCATDAIKALNILNNEEHDFDVILTDYCMPAIDGMEFALMTKKFPKYANTPIILITSRSQIGDYKNAKAVHLSGYLPKPIRKNDIIDCMSMVLDNARTTKQLITKHTLKEIRRSKIGKILVVEDNPLNQKILAKMLGKIGVVCDVAGNGEDAINACIDNHYDLIFMDCHMPILDGFETTKKIIELGRQIPVIGLSADPSLELIQRCTDSGMCDCLEKPFDLKTIEDKLDEYAPQIQKQQVEIVFDVTPYSVNASETKESIAALVEKDMGIPLEDSKEMIEEFVHDTLVKLEDISNAVGNMDAPKVIILAHSIRGAAGNLRMNTVFEYATDLEKSARISDLSEAPEIVKTLKEYLTELK